MYSMTETTIEFSIPKEFIDAADRLCAPNIKPMGYAINAGPVETKTEIFGIFTDKTIKNCVFVLTRWMDGTGIFLRYPRHCVHLTN